MGKQKIDLYDLTEFPFLEAILYESLQGKKRIEPSVGLADCILDTISGKL